MKIKLKAGDYDATLDIGVMEVELVGAYNGVGIQTDQGHFGIAQRDSGIEVLLDGKTVFASHDDVGKLRTLNQAILDFRDEVHDDSDPEWVVDRLNSLRDLIPGWIKAADTPTDIVTEGGG